MYDKLTNDCPKEKRQPGISYAEILWQYQVDCLPYRAEITLLLILKFYILVRYSSLCSLFFQELLLNGALHYDRSLTFCQKTWK